MSEKRKILLCILDGWGCMTHAEDDAIFLARKPVFDHLLQSYPNCRLKTSGEDVGLPKGQAGNSEIGHSIIGCGRIMDTDITRIDKLILSNKLGECFTKFSHNLNGACHIMGLLSDGGVHAHYDHLEYITGLMAKRHKNVYIHCFLDGRDVPPTSSVMFLEKLQTFIKNKSNVKIATISGRFYAMDRDKNWDRTKKAYDAIMLGRGEFFGSPVEHVKRSYDKGVNDEFILPAVNVDYNGARPIDGLVMVNFRADRVRQILSCLLDNKFVDFPVRSRFESGLGMSEYSETLNKIMYTVLEPVKIANSLGSIMADEGYRQLRISETEKYAHVTFFFNGGTEEQYKEEERIIVPSPKVATYDMTPEMSSAIMTEKLCTAIVNFDFIVANYPGADMVGHTGNLNAAIKAVESIDRALGIVVDEVLRHDGIMIITADHGNAEHMVDRATKGPFTAHTCNEVPFIVVCNKIDGIMLRDGSLEDIAPTICHLAKIRVPSDMTGVSLIVNS